MIAVEVKVDTSETKAFLLRLEKELSLENVNVAVKRAALKVIPIAVVAVRDVIGLNKATGTRWNLEKPESQWVANQAVLGAWVVRNRSKVAYFLEHGTANKGTGFIRPKVKKFLYIPLKRRAAVWRPGLKASGWVTRKGVKRFVLRDYILAKKVRGMKPRPYLAELRAEAQKILFAEMKAFTKAAIQKAKR